MSSTKVICKRDKVLTLNNIYSKYTLHVLLAANEQNQIENFLNKKVKKY